MNSEKSADTAILIAANFFAVVVYLTAASAGWVEREIENFPGAAGGGAIVWFIFAVPVFLLSLLGNFGCFLMALIHRRRTGQWRFFWWGWLAVVGLWLAAVAYDFSRHGV